MSDPNPELTDHSYDGIQEYDNPLPGWWKNLFFLSFVFSIFYYLYFNTGVEGRSIHDDYNRQVSKMMDLRFAELGELEPTEENILKYMNEPKWLKVGEIVYKSNCIGCHGAEGQGITGPNLTDDRYKNIKKPTDIVKVISEGANNGAMPAWKNRLGHINKIVLTASYVASLRGKNIAGREAEGNEIPPWPTVASNPTDD